MRRNVRYGPTNPPAHISFVTDLSETGVCIKAAKVYPPGTKLYMEFNTGDRTYRAEGVVAWARRVPVRLIGKVKGGMGIRFTEVDEELVNLYRERTDPS